MNRLPLGLSTAALVVAVFASTPLAQAAENAVSKIAPRAKRADFAANAGAVNRIKASRAPPGWLVALGPDGKFPASVAPTGLQGPPGPKGDKGDKGDTGTPGLAAYQVVEGPLLSVAANGQGDWTTNCPAGKRPIGGGWIPNGSLWPSHPFPVANPTGWIAGFKNPNGNAVSARGYVVCATVGP